MVKTSSNPSKLESVPESKTGIPWASMISVIPSLSLSASYAFGIPSLSLSIVKQVKIRFPLKVELSTVLFSWCLKVIWLTLSATSLNGVVPIGEVLYLKRISAEEK